MCNFTQLWRLSTSKFAFQVENYWSIQNVFFPNVNLFFFFFFNTKLMFFCQNNWHTFFAIVRFIQINCKWLVKGRNRPKWFYLEILINKVLFCEIQKNLYLFGPFLYCLEFLIEEIMTFITFRNFYHLIWSWWRICKVVKSAVRLLLTCANFFFFFKFDSIH